MTRVDVLVTASGSAAGLAVTLASLVGQTCRDLRIVVSGMQGHREAAGFGEVAAVVRVLRARGVPVELRAGALEDGEFTLDGATAPYVLRCEAGAICQPDLVEGLLDALQEQRAGQVV